jgi:hypothetical protein
MDKTPLSNLLQSSDSSYCSQESIGSSPNYPKLDVSQGYLVQQNLPSFSHSLKKSKDSKNHFNEIFGNNQDFSRMDPVEIKQLSGAPMETKQETSAYSGVQDIYKAINEMFPDFLMTLVKQDGSYAVWKAVSQCLLCNGTRYVVAITIEKYRIPSSSRRKLIDLSWVSFQTRFSESDREVREFDLKMGKTATPKSTLLSDTIRCVESSDKEMKYRCDTLPLDVILIKSKEEDDFAERGTVATALSLYCTVLTLQK